MSDKWKELSENIQILKCHNEKHIPVLRITDGRKHEIEVIDEIVRDVSTILEKIEDKTLLELPCKVGDTMYKLCSVNSAIKMGQMWDGRIVETNCDRCGYRNCSCYDIGLRERNNDLFIDVIEEKKIYSLEFLVSILPYIGTIWFTTREEAEQALKGGVEE